MAKSDDKKVTAEMIHLLGDMSMALGKNLKIYAQQQEASEGTVKAFDVITEKMSLISSGFDNTIKNLTENLSPDAISSKILDITSTTDTEQKPPVLPTSPIPVAANSSALPVNDRVTKKGFVAQAAEEQTDVLEARLPASGFWKNLLEAVTGNKPDDRTKAGSGGGLLSSLLGMLGNLAGIATIMGVFAAIAGIATLVGAIATDSPVMSGLRAIFQAIGKFAFVIGKLAAYGKNFLLAFAKTGSFSEALKVAGQGGKVFSTITKYLTLIGGHIDDLFGAFKGLPPVLKGVAKHTGTFAKMLPRLGAMVFKGPLLFLPLIGTIVQFGFAAYRFSQGDWIGGAIDLCGGVLSLIADIIGGVGTGGAVVTFGGSAAVGWSIYAALNMMALGLGVLNFYLDHKAGGMTKTKDGLSVQPQKAAILVNLAKKALGTAALGALGAIFGPILQVVDGLKLIADGELMKGLSMMTTLDPRFNDILSLLGMEPEDLGLTQKQVDQQQGFATGIGKTMLKDLGKMLLLPFTMLFAAPLAIGEILFAIAKGGSVKDGLIELSHWLPFVKPLVELFDIESLQSDLPPFAELTASEMVHNLFDWVITSISDGLIWIIDMAIEGVLDTVDALKAVGYKIGDWIWLGLGSIATTIEPVVKALAQIIEEPFKLETWTNILSEVQELFVNIFAGVYTAWNNIVEWWDNLNFRQALKDFWENLTTDFDKSILREYNKVLMWINAKLSYIGDRLTKGRSWGFLKDIFQAIEDGFLKVVKDFIGYLDKSFVDFSAWMDNTYEGFKLDLSKWWSKTYGIWTTFMDDITAKVQTEFDYHKEKIDKLMELPRKIWSGFIDKVTKSIENAANSAATTIDNTLTAATTAFDDITNCLTSTFPKIVEFVCNIAKAVRNFFDNTLGKVKDILNIGKTLPGSPATDKVNQIYSKLPTPAVHEQAVEALSEAALWISEGSMSLLKSAKGLFKRSPWTWDILHEAGDALAQGAGKVVHSAVRLRGMVEKTFNLNLDSIASKFFASIPSRIRTGVMDYVETIISSFKDTFTGSIDKNKVIQKLITPISKANLELFAIVAPDIKKSVDVLMDPVKSAGGIINSTVNDIASWAKNFGLDIANLGDAYVDTTIEYGIKEMSRLMSIPQQVKISDLKPIDITINNDQFDKLIATQLKTYDVLNVQISKILTDINDNIQNIQINEGGAIPIPQEDKGYVGEATNASYNDRLMNRSA